MIELKTDELKNFLDTEEATFSFENGKNLLEVSPALTICFDEKMTDAEIKHSGYEIIRYDGDEEVFHDTFDSFEKAVGYLSEFIPVADTVAAAKLNGFATLEEFYDEKKFREATMEELIKRYDDCDEFSLTCASNEPISREKADEIIARERRSAEEECRNLYESENEGGLPPFEVLLDDVREECREFVVKKRKRFPEKKYGKYIAGFICDFVMDEKTKYYGQDFLWHFYITLGREYDNIAYINDKVLSGGEEEDDFAAPGFAFLKGKVLRAETGFENHCTKTSELLKTYYFPLDEETKKWLLTKKNDYDFSAESLCDLAFYKDGKLRFSSCTHENFHNDISNKKV